MKRIVISVFMIMSILFSGIEIYAANDIGNNDLHNFLENVTVFKDGEIAAIENDTIVQLSSDNKSVIFENQTAFVPSEYAKKIELSAKGSKDGYMQLTDCYMYDNLCFFSQKKLDETQCKKYASNIKRLFGVYVDRTKNGTGTKESPIGDIQAAINCVRSIKNSIGLPKGEFPVYFRDGIYPISKSIVFDKNDSGNENTRIVYRAYPDENVSFCGGITIDGSAFQKVTDPAILNRVDISAKSKLYSVDLNKYGLAEFGENVTNLSSNPKLIQLIYNNEPANIARWPNNDIVKTEKILIPNGEWSNPGFEFMFSDKRLQRWKDSKQAWVWGTWTWEWHAENHQIKKIDIDKKSILTATNSTYTPSEGKEWYIYNLLEEIDTPNEYFFDKEKGILYYYPNVENIKDGSFFKTDISVSLLSDDIVKGENCNYITFRNITFESAAGNGVNLSNISNCSIEGCTARNISGTALQVKDGYYNRVHGCDVYNIGTTGVLVSGGDRETLTHSNSEITNCRIFKTGQIQRTGYGCVSTSGCGIRVANNELFSVPSVAFQPHYSNENIIEYNEVYDGLTDKLGDMGVWYNTVDPTAFGNEIRYNYFHDTNYGIGTIYLDDGMCGYSVYGNLFHNVNRGIFMHGAQYCKIHDNVIYNSNVSGIYLQYLTHDVRWDPKTLTPASGASEKATYYMNTVNQRTPFYKNEIWSKKYPEVQDILATGRSYEPAHNEVYNNIESSPNGVKAAEINPVVEYAADLTKNYQTTDNIGFVDAENNDFRLKDDALAYKIYPDLDYLNFEKTGIYIDETRKSMPELTDFSLVYPENKQENVEASSVDFTWEPSTNTNKYRFILATDRDFEHILYDEYVIGTSFTVKNLRYQKSRYYWKVIAVSNNSKSLGNTELQCRQQYFSFTTVEEPVLNYDKVTPLLEEMTEIYDNMTEGENQGEYISGTKQELGELLNKYKASFYQKGLSQIKLNTFYDEFATAAAKLKGQRNQEYQTFKNLFAQSYWDIKINTVSFNNEGFMWTSNGTDNYGGFGLRKLEPYETVKVRATFDLETGWQGIALRANSTTSAGWGGNCQYIVIVKPDVLELQCWKPNGSHFFFEYPNKCIESGKEYLIEYGIKNKDDGSVDITFAVDGENIIEYNDADNPILTAGYLEFYNTSAGRNLIIKTAEEK